MAKYPYSDKERTCWQHKERMEWKRDKERMRLREGEPKIEHSDN